MNFFQPCLRPCSPQDLFALRKPDDRAPAGHWTLEAANAGLPRSQSRSAGVLSDGTVANVSVSLHALLANDPTNRDHVGLPGLNHQVVAAVCNLCQARDRPKLACIFRHAVELGPVHKRRYSNCERRWSGRCIGCPALQHLHARLARRSLPVRVSEQGLELVPRWLRRDVTTCTRIMGSPRLSMGLPMQASGVLPEAPRDLPQTKSKKQNQTLEAT